MEFHFDNHINERARERGTDIDEIKKLRSSLGLTQKDLAQRADVSQSLIAKIEAGRIDPTFSKVQKIFLAFN